MIRPSIKVCLATYGDYRHWGGLVRERSWPSVDRQTVPPVEVGCAHKDTLAEARNSCARESNGEWLCFLDADDELDEGYIEAMGEVIKDLDGPALIQPSTLGVYPDGREDPYPVLIPPKPLIDGNYLIIGTLIRHDQFHRIGGFRELPMYEDWDVWLRAWLDGARVIQCPKAIYRVHVSTAGRNSAERPAQIAMYNQIRQLYLNQRRVS